MVNQLPEKASKKIWVDLDNSPHVFFFSPIIAELTKRGYTVVVTARDCFQVPELTRLLRLDCKLIGRHFGKHKLLKLFGLFRRSLLLTLAVRKQKFALAVSHGSRAQLVAAATLRIPRLLVEDYEFARGLWILMPNWVLLPEVIPASGVGTNADRVLKYPGIKEDVYVSRFEPDPCTRSQLQVKEDDVLVMVRPPADEAHYHNPESGVLYHAVMEFLGDKPNVRVILLPRDERQKAAAFRAWPGLLASGRVTIPSHVSDGRNLIWHSDLVISGGGTMNREAAALGVPVYSIFRGKIGAVDRYLAEKGRLILLQSPDEIPNKIRLIRRPVPAKPASGDRAILDAIVNTIVSIAETGCPPSKDTANLL